MTRTDRHDTSVRAGTAGTEADVAGLTPVAVVTAYAIVGNGCFTAGSSRRSTAPGSTGDTAGDATGESAQRRPLSVDGRIVGAVLGMRPDAAGHASSDAAPGATVHGSKAIPHNCAAEAETARARQ
ncbi:hypothetical protein ABZ725_21475 [Streptomyces sp. NPDC006872]|uniref:hypothetical protein n=1 Tax=Streptomyces sp. NPDC006872 TaxID=3155720 RepID=UPI0033CD15E5